MYSLAFPALLSSKQDTYVAEQNAGADLTFSMCGNPPRLHEYCPRAPDCLCVVALRCPRRAARPFEARLVQVGSKAVVAGKDFDPDTGEIKEKLDASKLVSSDAVCLLRPRAFFFSTPPTPFARCACLTWCLPSLSPANRCWTGTL